MVEKPHVRFFGGRFFENFPLVCPMVRRFDFSVLFFQLFVHDDSTLLNLFFSRVSARRHVLTEYILNYNKLNNPRTLLWAP